MSPWPWSPNVSKHAGAAQFTLRLVASHPNLVLRIEDDGKGFEVAERRTAAAAEKHLTEWKWEVKPTSSGRQALHLTLSAQLTVDGQPTSKLVRTFDKTIEVNVTMAQKAGDFIDKFGQCCGPGSSSPWPAGSGDDARPRRRQKSPKRSMMFLIITVE